MSGRLAVPLLLLLAAGLAGTLAWQLLGSDGMETRPAAMPEPAGAGAANRAAAGQAAANPVMEQAATLLARPLFSADRRPPPPGAMAAAVPDAPLPRLTGTLVTPESRSAIFAGGAQPVVVREGGIIGRFSIQRIEPGRVTLSGPGGVQVIGTAFDPAAPRPRAAPPAMGVGQLPASLPGSPPGTFPGLADAPQDAMPFETNPAPSGMDIIREQARRRVPGAGPAQ